MCSATNIQAARDLARCSLAISEKECPHGLSNSVWKSLEFLAVLPLPRLPLDSKNSPVAGLRIRRHTQACIASPLPPAPQHLYSRPRQKDSAEPLSRD